MFSKQQRNLDRERHLAISLQLHHKLAAQPTEAHQLSFSIAKAQVIVHTYLEHLAIVFILAFGATPSQPSAFFIKICFGLGNRLHHHGDTHRVGAVQGAQKIDAFHVAVFTVVEMPANDFGFIRVWLFFDIIIKEEQPTIRLGFPYQWFDPLPPLGARL